MTLLMDPRGNRRRPRKDDVNFLNYEERLGSRGFSVAADALVEQPVAGVAIDLGKRGVLTRHLGPVVLNATGLLDPAN